MPSFSQITPHDGHLCRLSLDQAWNDYFEDSFVTLLMQAVLKKNHTNSYLRYSLATASRLSADG